MTLGTGSLNISAQGFTCVVIGLRAIMLSGIELDRHVPYNFLKDSANDPAKTPQ